MFAGHDDNATSWFSRNAITSVTTPTRILTGGAAQVAAGENHSLILKDNGSLWAVGGNQYGELGTGDNVDRNDTVQVVASGVVQVATGGRSIIPSSSSRTVPFGPWDATQAVNSETAPTTIATRV